MLVSFVSLLVMSHPVALRAPIAAMRYRIEVRSEVIVGAPNDADYINDLTEATAYVTLTMSDTTIGRFANFTVDSSSFNGGQTAMVIAMETPALLKNPRGTQVRFLVVGNSFAATSFSPTVVPADDNLPMSTIFPGLVSLFPGVRQDVKAGSTWADTMKAPGAPDQITKWTITTGDGDALQYESTRSVLRRSSAPDSTVMNGKELSTQTVLTGPFGPARKFVSETTLEGLITGGGAGAAGVPIRTKRTLKVIQL